MTEATKDAISTAPKSVSLILQLLGFAITAIWLIGGVYEMIISRSNTTKAVVNYTSNTTTTYSVMHTDASGMSCGIASCIVGMIFLYISIRGLILVNLQRAENKS